MDEPRFNFASRDDVVDGAHDLRQTDSSIRGNIGRCESTEGDLENLKDTRDVEHNKHVLNTSDGAIGVGNGGGPNEPNEETFVHDEEPANSQYEEGGTSSYMGNYQKEGNVNEGDDILKFQDNVAIGNHVHVNEQQEIQLVGGDNLLFESLEVDVYAQAEGWDERAQLEDGKPEVEKLLTSNITPKFEFHFTKSNASLREISIKTTVRFCLNKTTLQIDDKNQDRFGWFHNNLRMSLGGLASSTILDEGGLVTTEHILRQSHQDEYQILGEKG
ncbi:unnamed protein product [Sphagnum jensenii]|uniref:Uncharacterized protein n=1 Tax=Sphagnum jensenii TaxID=128206 RepID=A0ABP1BJ19_9BRYO